MADKKKKLNKKELVDTFYNIDNRISDLHIHSSEVFLQLNGYLKDYYEKIKIISENASRIFEAIIGDDQNNLIDELDQLYTSIKEYKLLAENENSQGITNLNEVGNMVSFLLMDLRNLNQNLITLKYLITNYRLITSYETNDLADKSNIQQWFESTEKMLPWISTAINETELLKKMLYALLNSDKTVSKDSSKSIAELSDDIRSIYRTFMDKTEQSEQYFPLLKEKSVHSSESIGNIITHLQYHDIIRQKIEHIQQSHLKIVNQLKPENRVAVESNDDDVGHIADIVALQAEQLILVSKEYQNAIKVITHNFRSIANDTSTISRISDEFSTDERNREVTLLGKIKMKLDQGIMMLDSSKITLVNADLLKVSEQIAKIQTILSKKVTTPMLMMEKEKLLKSGKDLSLKGENPKVLGIIYLIYNLAEDLAVNRKDINARLGQLGDLNERLKEPLSDIGLGSESEQEQIRLMVKITQILDKLDQENEKLDRVLRQNGTLNEEILGKIEGTINKVDYYDLFETVINEVIGKLNYINMNLRLGDIRKDSKATKDSLKEIEDFYTVASERMIHQKYVGDEAKQPEQEEDNSDDLELF